MLELTSRSNPKFKFLKSLAKSRNRKSEGVFLMEGREELDMAHSKSIQPLQVFFSDAYVSHKELSLRYNENCELIQMPKSLFDELTYQNVPGNYIGIFESWNHSLAATSAEMVTVVLESVEKPGNLGAILRTCVAAGVSNVLVADSELDLFNPNIIRNSRGAFLLSKVVFASSADILRWCQKQALNMYVTTPDDSSMSYAEVDKTHKRAYIFGSEARGASEFWKSNAQSITIPMKGEVDSLNLSVSVGIVIFS